MPNFEEYCRCPGCGECDAAKELKKLKTENKRLRTELRSAACEVHTSARTGQASRRPDWANPLFRLRERMLRALGVERD